MNETDRCLYNGFLWEFTDLKARIQARYTEIHGREPNPEELARTCWDVWRLTNVYTHALDALGADRPRESSTPNPHAPYIPLEVIGELPERLEAMDARLQEVLGDSIDEDVEADNDEDDDEEVEFHFQPDAAEQIFMVQYGEIIFTYEVSITDIMKMQLDEDTYIQNIAMENIWGFDHLLEVLRQAVQEPQTH